MDYIAQAPTRILTENARTALFQGLMTLPSSDRAEILVPAYNCGAEVQTVFSTGARITWYPVNRSCIVDPDDIRKRINKSTRAVLVTHYNGFPQPIEEIVRVCAGFDVPVVEDCAHVLRSEIPAGKLGSFGRFAVFSPHKFLPIPAGGILVLHAPLPDVEALQVRFESGPSSREALSIAAAWARRRGLKLPALSASKSRLTTRRENIGEEQIIRELGPRKFTRRMSLLSQYLLERQDIVNVAEIRRRNYAYLQGQLEGCSQLQSLMGRLREGVCPMFFLARSPDAGALNRYLSALGIQSVVFWSYFHEKYPFGLFPDAEGLKLSVIALPVHQELSLEDMALISGAIQKQERSFSKTRPSLARGYTESSVPVRIRGR